ncbi:hypothetical protein CDAR_286221 [Caerostris darwini]|uniref:Uncharacterized protein n=1 Tax=Caerostris darwini TaxID=1538125 RepID=A0AAV4N4H7_9ARAC|nr:hypothetical protein CDAR_286221 [Caerostris darwini]
MRKRRFSDAQRRYMVNENQALIKSCLLSYSNYVTGFSNSPDIHFSPSASAAASRKNNNAWVEEPSSTKEYLYTSPTKAEVTQLHTFHSTGVVFW